MTISTAYAQWEGDLKSGAGSVSVSGGCSGQLDFATRFERGGGLTPESLIGGALASCFSMAFAHRLFEAGHPSRRVETSAEVSLERQHGGFRIEVIHLSISVDVEGIDDVEIRRLADEVTRTCPVAQALGGGVRIDHSVSIGTKVR